MRGVLVRALRRLVAAADVILLQRLDHQALTARRDRFVQEHLRVRQEQK